MITTMICVEWCLTRYPTKIFVTDAIRVRLAPYSIHDYPYLYSRISVFVFVFEVIRIRIRIRLKIWKQIWFHWYPSVFDPITPLGVCYASEEEQWTVWRGIFQEEQYESDTPLCGASCSWMNWIIPVCDVLLIIIKCGHGAV
jgi:hypothetical protein